MEIPKIKICCIGSMKEATTAIAAGASAVGLVSAMPSGPGVIAEHLITQIASQVRPPVATFLLTCLQQADRIVAQHRRCLTTTIQLCDRLAEGAYNTLRQALPGVTLVQVIHVNGQESYDEALRVAPRVDALLLDSGNQKLAVKQLGGTGRVHDWSISRRIREAVDKPVYLAGGLNAENVAKAVEQVGPFGVDVCSGVRTNGRLDEAKLLAFVNAVRRAGQGETSDGTNHVVRL